MPQFDVATFPPQLIWLVISFVVLYVLMSRVALPRVGRVLEERQKRIDDALKTAEQLNAEAQDEARAYDTLLRDARARGREVIQAATADMAEEAHRRHETLGEDLSTRIKAAESDITAAKNAAITGIRNAAAEVAGSAIKHLVGDDVPADQLEKAVDAALEGRRR